MEQVPAPPLFQIQEAAVAVPSVDDHLRRIQEVWDSARAAITRSGEINKKMADRHRVPAPAYRVGQQVWLSAKDLPLATEGRKMNPRYVGPYPIEQIVNPSAVRLTLPAALKVHPTFHVSLLKPVGESEFSPPAKAPPAPLVIEGHPAHRVSRILDVRRRGRGFQYLVDWEGYGPEERSWLPRRQIFGSTLFREFYRDNPGKPGRPPGGAR
uniref:Chromo domain-containing protein n=1 Tax=Gasterosteus aculeatus aculeatus TaxID=481459 RepID=A0AAQ4QFT7_GASAC